MQIIFVLDQDTDTDEIERELRQISGISWVLGSNNLAIHVHEKLLESTEERILDSVARGVFPGLRGFH